jgi:hypothetical protein
MSNLAALKSKIGDDMFQRLDKEANKEVGLAKQMPLLEEVSQKQKFYIQRDWLGDLLQECELFEDKKLKIMPTEVVDLLFRCKMLYAAGSEMEYRQRTGGWDFNSPVVSAIHWTDKSQPIEAMIEQALDSLNKDVRERSLLIRLNSFVSAQPQNLIAVQSFFNTLFQSLRLPMEAFIVGESLIESHKKWEPYGKHTAEAASDFYQSPSIAFKTLGSQHYCFWRSAFFARTFLNLLRIGSFIHPGQIEFGREVKIEPPYHPVFLGTHSHGCFVWNEDKKAPWAKVPDGSLFLSFGYRGFSPMWLDRRTFSRLTQFMTEQKPVFTSLENPWVARSIDDVVPALDILSSAVQIPDLGAKILLIYTCLEHLFVPSGTRTNQKHFIIGGLNALRPSFLPWFEKLYTLRCDYAHRGFVIRSDETIALTIQSAGNALNLLLAKLTVP